MSVWLCARFAGVMLWACPIILADEPVRGVSFPSYRIYPGNVSQSETIIVSHPTNPSILFASANTIQLSPFFVSEGIYVSTDGGTSWRGTDTCNGSPVQFHGGDPGIAVDKDSRFILTRLGRSPFPGLYSHFSTDNGLTWSSQRTITTDDLERANLATNTISTSPRYGHTYAVYVRFIPPYPVMFTQTTDGAVTWTSPLQINSPSQRCAGGDIAIGPDGSVNVCWGVVTSTSPFTEVAVGFARSTDGGAVWSVQESAFPMNGIQGVLSGKQNIRVNGLPRIAADKSGGVRNGWLYIVTTQKNLSPAGSDPDIILRRSTNSGVTWSSAIRVNRDPLNNGKTQYFPAIHVDDGGGINILYYDDRHTTNDSAGVVLSRSLDGGTSWQDYVVSDHTFRPQPIGGLGQGYQGDNIGLTSVGTTLWPVWMDNSTGLYQIWTAPINLQSVGVTEGGGVPALFSLRQNHPNPFNPSTTITYELPASGNVRIAVTDMLGREVARLIDSQQSAGIHEVVFAGENNFGVSLPAGLYFYTLRYEGRSETRKMLLLR